MESCGITHAVIVDDVFETPGLNEAKDLPQFWLEYSENRETVVDYQALDYILKDVSADVDITDEHVAQCWLAIECNPSKLEPLSFHLLGDFAKRRTELNELAELLERILGNRTQCLPPSEKIPDAAKLVFLDYFLGPTNKRSIEIAKELSDRKGDRPYLILISDSENLEDKSRAFRDTTGYIAGTYGYLEKAKATDESELTYSLASWGLGNPALPVIQPLFDGMIAAVDDAAAEIKSKISKLTIQDYSVLQNFSLSEDGHPLGEYVIDLFGAALSFRFRDSVCLRAARNRADESQFGKHLPLNTAPGEVIVELYREAMTEPAIDPNIAEHPWKSAKKISVLPDVALSQSGQTREVTSDSNGKTEIKTEPEATDKADVSTEKLIAPEIAWLSTGDIFAKDDSSSLFMVLNAGCDLQFAPGTNRECDGERSILLIEGIMSAISDPQPPINVARTEYFKFDDSLCRVTWLDRLLTLSHKDFKAEMTKKGYHRRVARLSLPYALQVQQAWVSKLGRVGVPVAPPHSSSFKVSLYRKDDDGRPEQMTAIENGVTAFRVKGSNGYINSVILSQKSISELRTALQSIRRELAASGAPRVQKRLEAIDRHLNDSEIWRKLQEEPRKIANKPLIDDIAAICATASVAPEDFINNSLILVHLELSKDLSIPSKEKASTNGKGGQKAEILAV